MNEVSDNAVSTLDLTMVHGRKQALAGLSLDIPRGGIHAIVGANGAGKSTLFRVLLGFTRPSDGQATVLGHPSKALTVDHRRRIGFVNEEHSLPGWVTVAAVLDMQRDLYADRWDVRAFDSVATSFDLLPEQRVSQLSRGERAGFNLALALGQNPELLILDEPTLGLDVVARRRLMEALINTVDSDERTIIYCSHQIEEVERLADSLILLERGALLSQSAPDEFCARVSLWSADVPFKGPPKESIIGLLQHRCIDQVHHYTMLDAPTAFGDFLKQHGAKSVQTSTVPLDHAVDAILTRNHAGFPN